MHIAQIGINRAIPRERIINIDQTNWGTVAAGLPTCAGKGGECINVLIDNDDKEAPTTIAAGNELPLTIVGKGKIKRGLTRFQPPGDVWGTFSESGWTTSDVLRK
jgi:hypothetical protein